MSTTASTATPISLVKYPGVSLHFLAGNLNGHLGRDFRPKYANAILRALKKHLKGEKPDEGVEISVMDFTKFPSTSKFANDKKDQGIFSMVNIIIPYKGKISEEYGVLPGNMLSGKVSWMEVTFADGSKRILPSDGSLDEDITDEMLAGAVPMGYFLLNPPTSEDSEESFITTDLLFVTVALSEMEFPLCITNGYLKPWYMDKASTFGQPKSGLASIEPEKKHHSGFSECKSVREIYTTYCKNGVSKPKRLDELSEKEISFLEGRFDDLSDEVKAFLEEKKKAEAEVEK
jgi:hypothetical protein